jgi:hypothetical protein
MPQAAGITTPIRQLMSRRRPPKTTSPVRRAHTEFVAALAGNAPHPIYAGAHADNLDGRANHLGKLFAALHDYLPLIVSDTAQNMPSGALDRRYLHDPFQDLSADAVGTISNATEGMRDGKNWSGP